MKKGAYFVVGDGLESYCDASVEKFQNGFWFCERETHVERIRRREISLLTVYHNAFRLFHSGNRAGNDYIHLFSCKYFCLSQFAREGKRNYLTFRGYVTLWRGNRFVGVYQDKKGDGERKGERFKADNETEIRQGTGELVGIGSKEGSAHNGENYDPVPAGLYDIYPYI